MVNFWCSFFQLPKSYFDTIDSLCGAFLWSGSPNNNSKAKVSWEEACKSKKEGGLGIRRLCDSSRVYALSLIWRLFSMPRSLWVAWVRRYLIRSHSFWDMSKAGGSWVWRKLLKLRELARVFLKFEIKDGNSTMFWLDNWHN